MNLKELMKKVAKESKPFVTTPEPPVAKPYTYKQKKVRQAVPWLELQWLKFKARIRKAIPKVKDYVDKKIEFGIGVAIKQFIISWGWVILLAVLVLVATLMAC